MNDILCERIKAAEIQGLKRELVAQTLEAGPYVTRGGHRYLHFSGNDYLGLRQHPDIVAAARSALDQAGAGSGASRLVTGNHAYYAPLETALAMHKKSEAALVFGSGYLANIGAISALVEEGDLILADKFIHASMLDGAKLSGATLKRFAHNDTAHLERLLKEHRGAYRHCLVLSESIFSMDGDHAPISALAELAKAHDAWLLIDDAHGLGEPNDAVVDVWIGTLSKALGSYGGYVAGSKPLIDYLTGHARSLIFATALPPASLAAAEAALRIMQAEPERRERALNHAKRITHALKLPEAQSAIVPVIIGEAQAATAASHKLAEQGIWASAIRPPTVPQGTARLRITCSALHEDMHIDQLIAALT